MTSEDGLPEIRCPNCGHDARPNSCRKGGLVCGVCRVRLEGPKAKRREVEEARFFVNADASFVGDFAGIAYESAVIGSGRKQIQCPATRPPRCTRSSWRWRRQSAMRGLHSVWTALLAQSATRLLRGIGSKTRSSRGCANASRGFLVPILDGD
jgi:hypothetical protein